MAETFASVLSSRTRLLASAARHAAERAPLDPPLPREGSPAAIEAYRRCAPRARRGALVVVRQMSRLLLRISARRAPLRTSWGVRRAAALVAAGAVGRCDRRLWLAPRARSAARRAHDHPRRDVTDHHGPELRRSRRTAAASAYISGDARQILVRPTGCARAGRHPDDRGLYQRDVPVSRWPMVRLHREQLRTEEDLRPPAGAPLTVLTMDGPSRGAAWGPTTQSCSRTGAPETGLQRVASSGGAVTVLTRPNHERGEADHVQPAWLPDGRQPALHDSPCTRRSRCGEGRDSRSCDRRDTHGARGRLRRALRRQRAPRVCGGRRVMEHALRSVAAARHKERRSNCSRPVTIEPVGGAAEFDIAGDGTLAYSRGATSSDRAFLCGSIETGARHRCRRRRAPTDILGFPRTASASRSIRTVGRRGRHLHLGGDAPLVLGSSDDGRTGQ